MSLSRLQKQTTDEYNKLPIPPIINTTIHSSLCSISFFSNLDLFNKINFIDNKIRSKHGYISVIQGIYETNVIIDQAFLPLLNKHIIEKPKNLRNQLASLNIQIAEHVYETPCQFYPIVQAITLQGINIYEITSAFSELIFYLDQKDIKIAFDTVYNIFQANSVEHNK